MVVNTKNIIYIEIISNNGSDVMFNPERIILNKRLRTNKKGIK